MARHIGLVLLFVITVENAFGSTLPKKAKSDNGDHVHHPHDIVEPSLKTRSLNLFLPGPVIPEGLKRMSVDYVPLISVDKESHVLNDAGDLDLGKPYDDSDHVTEIHSGLTTDIISKKASKSAKDANPFVGSDAYLFKYLTWMAWIKKLQNGLNGKTVHGPKPGSVRHSQEIMNHGNIRKMPITDVLDNVNNADVPITSIADILNDEFGSTRHQENFQLSQATIHYDNVPFEPVQDVLSHEVALTSLDRGTYEGSLLNFLAGQRPDINHYYPVGESRNSRVSRVPRALHVYSKIKNGSRKLKKHHKRPANIRQRQLREAQEGEGKVSGNEVLDYSCEELYNGTMSNDEAVIQYLVNYCPIVDLCDIDIQGCPEDYRSPCCMFTEKNATCLACVFCIQEHADYC